MLNTVELLEFGKQLLFKQIAIIPCDRYGKAVDSEESSVVGIVVSVEKDGLTINVPTPVPEMQDDDDSSYEHRFLDKGLYPGDLYLDTLELDIDDVFHRINFANFPEKESFLLVKVIDIGVDSKGLVTVETKQL